MRNRLTLIHIYTYAYQTGSFSRRRRHTIGSGDVSRNGCLPILIYYAKLALSHLSIYMCVVYVYIY